MTAVADFSTKLALALKALSMSRGRLAADLGVDKSLVGRWASGAVSPSDHNLANLTRLIASKTPGMAVWREKLFAWMLRNAATAMEFFRLPTNRVVELGSQIEI